MKPLSAETLLEPVLSPKASREDVQVVLADYNGWWAPLTHLFYSNTSRCLVSVHPESSMETVESYYCPNCLTTFAEAETSIAANRCPKCFECPECQSILTIAPLASSSGGTSTPRFHFVCGYCHWSSDSVGLVEEDPDYLGMAASVAERDSPQEEKFHRLLNKLRFKAVKVMEQAGDHSARVSAQTLASQASMPMSPPNMSPTRADAARLRSPSRRAWRLSDLQDKEEKAQEERESQDLKKTAVLYPHGWTLEQLASDDDAVPTDFLAMSTLDGVSRAAQRLAHCLHQPESSSELRPLRTPLFTKRSRRCRKDVEEGRPGILLKPKVNPLEGDSSMRSNVGRWWNKDSSAIHVLPRISVLTLPELDRLQRIVREQQDPQVALSSTSGGGAGGLSLVLKLVNPIHGKVTVTLVPQEVAEAAIAAQTTAAANIGAPGSESLSAEQQQLELLNLSSTLLQQHQQPYFRKRLAQALGDPNAVILQADLPPTYEEEATVVLEGYEDEYLDDEEGGSMADFSAEQAISQGGLTPKGAKAAHKVVMFRSKYTAWFQVPIVLEDVMQFRVIPSTSPPTTFGVLLFFRFSSTQREFTAASFDYASDDLVLASGIGTAASPSCASIIVPALVAVRLPAPGSAAPPPTPTTPITAAKPLISSPSKRRISSPLVLFSSPHKG